MARTAAELDVEFTVNWHPYFLDVTLSTTGLAKRESYRSKGMNEASLAKMERSMSRAFEAEGISYTLDGDTGNTVDSHRLAAWAYSKFGATVQNQLVDVMFRQFFSDKRSPADRSALREAAEEVGIDGALAAEFLESDAGRQHVLEQAHALMTAPSVTGVPHYFVTVQGTQTAEKPAGVANQIPGAQDTETFYLALKALVAKAKQQARL